MLQQEGERLFLTPEQGVELTLDGEPVTGRVELHDDTSETPSVLGFDEGKGLVTVIVRDGRRALRVKHAAAETRTQFAGLDYWPAAPSWKIPGKFVANPPGKTLPAADTLGSHSDHPHPAAVAFERERPPMRHAALGAGHGELPL